MTAAAHRYRIVRPIARGGMGEVFEAVAVGDSGFERRVALKRLTDDGSRDPRSVRMFVDEARIASKLHHAGVVAVLDYGVIDDAPFQVLELVDGMSASGLLHALQAARRAMPVEVAMHIAREVAHALEHAHSASDERGPLGIVHRDVKPANVLLSWDGDVKLGDFGIARARERTEHTATGDAKGTNGYMAPEQAAALGVDARADVFSLGATLLALVLGRNLLADPAAQLGVTLRDELALPPDLPEDVATIARRALRRAPSDRFGSAGEMADALSEAIAKHAFTDGRRALGDLLAAARPARTRPGALDALLSIDIVPADAPPPIAGEARTWTARPAGPGPEEGRPSQLPTRAEGRPPVLPAVAAADDAHPARGRWRVAVLALLAVIGCAFAIWIAVRSERVEPGPPVVPTAQSPVDELSRSTTASSDARAVAPSSFVPPPDGSASAITADMAPASARTPPPSLPRSAATSSASAAPLVAGERGVIGVGGDPAARIRVAVDGAFVGNAPTFPSVTVGSHTVKLTHPDGRVYSTTVQVTAAHTVRSPLRVMPPW